MTIETIFFVILAVTAVVSAVLLVTRVNPMHSALLLIVNFIALAGIYLTLHAQFVAIMQVLVYAGAIMVLVLFVIMLLNLQDEARLHDTRSWRQYSGAGLAVAVLAALIPLLGGSGAFTTEALAHAQSNPAALGTVESIGNELFRNFLFPFEMASLLLLAAIVGAVVLAKKRFP